MWWAVSRVVTIAAFAGCYALGPQGRFGPQLYRSPLQLLGAWDGLWYRRVAAYGYLMIPHRQSDPAFFPAFPILLRELHRLGIPFTLAGVVVSTVSLAVAAVAFYELGRRVVDPAVARRAACFLAISPMGFVFSMSYPEGLALALITLALLAAVDDRWLACAALMAVAALVRPEAVLFTIPLAGIAFSHRSRLAPGARGHALAAILAAPVGVATYPLYLGWSIHDPGAWGQAEQFWGRAFRISGPLRAFEHLPRLLGSDPWLARDLVCLILYAGLLGAAAQSGVGLTWIAAGALVLALPLFSGSVESEGRFGLLALPIYWGLAALTRRRALDAGLRLVCLVLLAAGVLTLPYVWP